MNCLNAEQLAELQVDMDVPMRADALAHLDACPPCREFRAELSRALAKLEQLPVMYVQPEPRPDTWRKIEARLREPVVSPAPEVTLGCAFCKGKLARSEAVYCAGCLAPHHHDCWAEHGKCAACAADALVRAERVRARRRVVPVAIALACGLGIGAAALAPWKHAPGVVAPKQESAPPPVSSREPPAEPAPLYRPTYPDVSVDDTVRSGFFVGRVTAVTSNGIRVRQWRNGAFRDEAFFSPPLSIEHVSLEAETDIPVNGGSIKVKEERFKEGSRGWRTLRVYHVMKDKVLVRAVVELGGADPAHAIGPLFAGDVATLDVDGDPFKGEVALRFDPANDVAEVTAPETRTILVRELASPWLDATKLERVARIVALNGDPELALALACRSPGSDLEQTVLEEQFAGMGGRAAQALVDHIVTPIDRFETVEALPTGTLERHPPKGFVLTIKERELQLLARVPAALAGGRAWQLYAFQEATASLRAEVTIPFKRHIDDAIDAFMRVPGLDAAAVNGVGAFLEQLDGAVTRLVVRVGEKDASLSLELESEHQHGGRGLAARALARLRQDLSSTPRKP